MIAKKSMKESLEQCFPSFFSPRPTFNLNIIARPTMKYDQTNENIIQRTCHVSNELNYTDAG